MGNGPSAGPLVSSTPSPWSKLHPGIPSPEVPLVRRLPILVALCALVLPTLVVCTPAPAFAQDAVPETIFVVDGVAIPGFGGEMTALGPDDQTAAALVFAEGAVEGTPIGPGTVLQAGDRIRCARARVVIRRGEDEYIHVQEGAEVTLSADRSITQTLGEVYYRVREAFRVEYGTVETTVEGTRFLVAGTPTGVAVSVDEGVVSVRTPGGVQQVSAGQTLATPPTAAPPTPSAWSRAAQGKALASTVGMGRPRLMVGVLAQGSYTGASADTLQGVGAMQLRPLGSIHVAGPVRVLLEPGVAAGGRTFQIPVNAGLELSVKGISAGGTLTTTKETRRAPCGATQELLHIGGAGHVRAELPLGRHLRGLASARVGVASVVQAELGAGVGWAL